MKRVKRAGFFGGIVALAVALASLMRFTCGAGPVTQNNNPPSRTQHPAKRGAPTPRTVMSNTRPTPGGPAANAQGPKPGERKVPPAPQARKIAPNARGSEKSVLQRYAFVLRSRSIHPVGPDNKAQEASIALKDLVKLGLQAKAKDRELHLRVQGDAKAKWLRMLKQTLDTQQIPYSISKEY